MSEVFDRFCQVETTLLTYEKIQKFLAHYEDEVVSLEIYKQWADCMEFFGSAIGSLEKEYNELEEVMKHE